MKSSFSFQNPDHWGNLMEIVNVKREVEAGGLAIIKINKNELMIQLFYRGGGAE